MALLGIGLLPSLVGFLARNAGVQRLGSGGAHLLGGLLIVGGSLWAVRSPV